MRRELLAGGERERERDGEAGRHRRRQAEILVVRSCGSVGVCWAVMRVHA